MFADLRGYTGLSQQIEASKMNSFLQRFYDQCAAAIWEREGIINKFIGDAVLAVFNFPLMRQDHAKNAVRAAIQLQKNCMEMRNELGLDAEHAPGVGIGIHTGNCSIGEVGTAYKDFTVIGPVVNLASRIQGAARSGEILITEEVYKEVKDDFPHLASRELSLKGINHPVNGYVIAQPLN